MENSEKLISRETSSRSLTKAFVYRFFAIIGTSILSWFITNDIQDTIFITVTVQVFLVILYYLNERVWNGIDWGKKISGR